MLFHQKKIAVDLFSKKNIAVCFQKKKIVVGVFPEKKNRCLFPVFSPKKCKCRTRIAACAE
jgi:hypothetical protein